MRKGQKIIDMGIIMSRGIALMKCQRKDQRIDRGLGIGKKTRSSPSSSPARLLTVAGEIKQRENHLLMAVSWSPKEEILGKKSLCL